MLASTPAEALAEVPAAGLGDAVGMVTGAVGVVEAEREAAAAAACAATSVFSPEGKETLGMRSLKRKRGK